MNEKIIYSYLQKKTSPEEERMLWHWINLSEENKAFFFEIKALWHLNRVFTDEKEIASSLARLNEKINREELKSTRTKQRIYLWSSAAAIALLTVISYIMFPRPAKDRPEATVYTNHADTVKMLTLADGTTVWLRSNTTLTCPASFARQTREVTLEGEAFFDVARKTPPFIVKTDVSLIKVAGTSFSVNTCIKGYVETTLVTGIIHLQPIGESSITVLHPGQSARYSREDKSLEIINVDPAVHTSWRYSLISLSEVSIHTVIRCIEDTWQVKLKMDTTSLKDRRYNFSFNPAKGVEEALNQLVLITGTPAELI
jgi:ferric-dicitrate binding protein FerR (iron transport regulator)